MKKLTIIIFLFLHIGLLKVSSQVVQKLTFNQAVLDKLEVYHNVYDYEFLGTSILDSVPCFTDNRNLKSTYPPKKYNLKVNIEVLTYDPNKSVIEVRGNVTEGWYGAGSEVHVYIGNRVDTVSQLLLATSYGLKFTEPIVIATSEAFYLDQYQHARSEAGQPDQRKRRFYISGPINENSLLAFALQDCYVEIFEIGKLIESIKPSPSNKGNQKSHKGF